MSSLLWINELEFCSGWQLEIQNHTTGKDGRNHAGHLIWPGAFHSEMILQGTVEERSAAILSQWNLNTESLLSVRESSKELESERTFSFSVHPKAAPLWIHDTILPDTLIFAWPAFLFYPFILFSSPEGKWFDSIYPLLKDRFLPCLSKAIDFRKKLNMAFVVWLQKISLQLAWEQVY